MEKIASIRPYQDKDYENLREICFVTATGMYTKNKEITASLFCEYYIEREGEHCFVVADKDDQAVGYILCAPDYDKYVKEFTEYKLPKVKKLSYKDYILRRLEFFYNKKIARKYPAHLHIDILDDYQRMGLGKKLLDALMKHLYEIGVEALHLGCGSKNEKGVNFYHKTGFHKIKEIAGVTVFGIIVSDYVSKLDKE